MKKFALVAACSVLSGLFVLASYPPLSDALPGRQGTDASHRSLVVEIKDQKNKNNLFGLKKKLEDAAKVKKTKKNDDDDDDDDKPKAQKKNKDKNKNKEQAGKTCGKKVNCEVGYVRLDKPNKYGACCEPREGLPPAKAAEPEKCKFPGEIGSPPNCTCPTGTEFVGYKGCVQKVVQRKICCTGIHGDSGGKTKGCRETEAEARKSIAGAMINNVPITSVTCAPE